MKINYTAHERKALVKAVGEFTGAEVRYLGAPTFGYQVDYFTVDREGFLIFDDMADSEEIEGLIEFLDEKGFTAEPPEGGEPQGDAVTIPEGEVNVSNLRAILKAKGSLIQKALGTATAEISETEEGVSFPWFPAGEEIPNAYRRFISALCKMSMA